MSIDIKHCDGCVDDFYNGHNPFGVKECWHRETAAFGKFRLIHVDQAPPYLHVKLQTIPSCYKLRRYVKVKPEALDAKGYWK
jgi:hypothetical protein